MQENAQTSKTFQDLGLKKSILNSIQRAGFTAPSPIQAEAIPHILQGKDLVGQAHTGTGKTAAFSLPALNNMTLKDGVELLVITPTRELATQVSDEIYKYGRDIGVKTVTIYGGSSYRRQLDLVERGAHVVVATPGRLLDILKKDMFKEFSPKMVVLDEADEMLDMGFLDDINEIFTYLPSDRQTLLFSATMPKPIKTLAERILHNPVFVSITKGETTNADIEQLYYVIEESERDAAIIRLMDSEKPNKSVVFCRTKSEVDRLATVLTSSGYIASGLHGDMEQRQREAVIKSFKNGEIDVLVATDVAARGIHVNGITHVFNYHIPFDPESYVHRIGRTGRAGTKGKAITLLTPLEFKELKRIKQKVGTNIDLAFVPSKKDLKEQSKDMVVKQILDQHIFEEAPAILDLLKEEIDEEMIIFKLISMVLDKNTVKGPNYIGIPQDKLAYILEKMEKRHAGGGNRGRGNYRGDSRNRSHHRGGRDRNRSRNRH